MTGILEGLIILCLATGVGLLAMRRHPSAYRIERISGIAIALLSLLLLWPGLARPSGWCLTPAPDTACASVNLSAPGIYLAVVALLALGIVQLGRPIGGAPQEAQAAWPGLGHLFCGLTVAALTVDQMMARYILVEIVGLLTLAYLLTGGAKGLPFWRDILVLRLAGATFLLAATGMYMLTDTLVIDTMIQLAAALPTTRAWPVSLFGLMAVWVKLGLPPTDGWIRNALRAPAGGSAMSAGIGLPLLGAYFAYRLQPVLLAHGLQMPLIVLGAAALIWTAVLRRETGAGRVLAGSGALAIVMIGTDLLPWYLLVFAIVRVAVIAGPSLLPKRSYALVSGRERAEQRPIAYAAESFLRPARTLLNSVEMDGLEGFNRGAAEAVRSVAAVLQRQHGGLLRRNLMWTYVGLVALIVISLLFFPFT